MGNVQSRRSRGMTRLAAVTPAERILRSGARWDMITVTSANGPSGTAQPRAMDFVAIRNRPVDFYDALQSFIKTTVSQPNVRPLPLQVVNPKFSTCSSILLPLRLVMRCHKLLWKPRTNFYSKLHYNKCGIRSSADCSRRGWRISEVG